MGTDIHGVFQRRNKVTGHWENVKSEYKDKCHYVLFAVLAGVRNGEGFAGVPTGQTVTPISQPRGLPKDVARGDRYMGDHTFSWLDGEEMLQWYSSAPKVLKVGVLSRSDYEQWDKVSPPQGHYGGVWGEGVIIVHDNELEKKNHPDWAYIECDWEQDLKAELAYFFDEVQRLQTEYGEIRFVFGFDS